MRSYWSRLVADKRLRDRRITRYGFGHTAWLPCLLLAFGAAIAAAISVADGAAGWATLGWVVLAVACLLMAWIVLTTEPPSKQ